MIICGLTAAQNIGIKFHQPVVAATAISKAGSIHRKNFNSVLQTITKLLCDVDVMPTK